MTATEALQSASRQLAADPHLADNARRDAELLLLHTLDITRAALLANPARELTPAEQQTYKAAITRRLRYEPIQYIIGTQEFYGLPFRVTPAAARLSTRVDNPDPSSNTCPGRISSTIFVTNRSASGASVQPSAVGAGWIHARSTSAASRSARSMMSKGSAAVMHSVYRLRQETLQPRQRLIQPLARRQFLVRPILHHPPPVNHRHRIRPPHRRQTVGDHDRRPPLH